MKGAGCFLWQLRVGWWVETWKNIPATATNMLAHFGIQHSAHSNVIVWFKSTKKLSEKQKTCDALPSLNMEF